jgi:WD40 repeat protein
VVFSGSSDETVRCWDTRAAAESFNTRLEGECTALDVGGGSTGTLMVVGVSDNLKFFDLRKPEAPLAVFDETHSEPVTSVQFATTPDSGGVGSTSLSAFHVLSASEDGTMAILDTSITGEADALVQVYPQSSGGGVVSCGLFGPGRGGIWSITSTSGLHLWSLSTAELVASFPGLPAACASAGIPCDELVRCHYDDATGRLVCAGTSYEAASVTLFNVSKEAAVPSGRLAVPPSAAAGHTDAMRCIDWIHGPVAAAAGTASPSAGPLVGCVTGGEDGKLCLWGDVATLPHAATVPATPVVISSAAVSAVEMRGATAKQRSKAAKARKQHEKLEWEQTKRGGTKASPHGGASS